jgi:dUTP pyrophosphatase
MRHQALFIPALGATSLLSVQQNMQWKGNYFHAETNTASLAFGQAIVDFDVNDEIETFIKPASTSTLPYTFDEANATPCSPTSSNHQPLHLVAKSVKAYLPEPKYHEQFQDTVQIMKLAPNAILPTRATKQSAGFDISSTIDTILQPGMITPIAIGLATALPTGVYIRIAPHSSFALKPITVEDGVVDADFRGEIKVLLKNNGPTPFSITPSTRIAQFIFECHSTPLL